MILNEQVKVKLSALLFVYQDSIKIITNENDVNKLNFDAIIENGFEEFACTDEQFISYITKKLEDNYQVAIQSAGKYKCIVFAAPHLF